MTAVNARHAYRQVLREVAKASIAPRATRNRVVTLNLRAMFEQPRKPEQANKFQYDIENAIMFMRSQRKYKELLDRYNPLIDLNAEERIQATARRVGFNMPVEHKSE